jgi:hypothetical protein
MATARIDPELLASAGQCVLCGASCTHRVDLVRADGASDVESSLPLCEDDHAREARRRVQVTLVVGSAKLVPIVAAWLLARRDGLDWAACIGVATLGAALLAVAERALLAWLHPRVRVEATASGELVLEVDSSTTPSLSRGGPSPRRSRALLDRSRPRLAVTFLVLAATALVAGWQWSLSRPPLWLHNPGTSDATVEIGDTAYPLGPGEQRLLHPLVGQYEAVVRTPTQQLQLSLPIQPMQMLLLATEPACYAIERAQGAELRASGQLFTLETGHWRRETCEEAD